MHACMHACTGGGGSAGDDQMIHSMQCAGSVQINLSNTCVCHVERVGESREHSATSAKHISGKQCVVMRAMAQCNPSNTCFWHCISVC